MSDMLTGGTQQFDAKVSAITISLRDRMRFYKIPVTRDAASIATTFNERFQPDWIPETNDGVCIDWIHEPTEEFYIGEKVIPTSNLTIRVTKHSM